MIAFEQGYFSCSQSRFEWLDDDLIRYQYRSINKKIVSIIPLSSIYPEPEIVKRTSRIAGILTFVGLALMFIFAKDYIGDSASWNGGWDIFFAEVFASMVFLFSGLYFWHSNRKKMQFYFRNGTLAFELFYQDDEKLDYFKDELIKKSIQATLREDENHTNILKKGISLLSRDKMISKEFEDILYERMMSITDVTTH